MLVHLGLVWWFLLVQTVVLSLFIDWSLVLLLLWLFLVLELVLVILVLLEFHLSVELLLLLALDLVVDLVLDVLPVPPPEDRFQVQTALTDLLTWYGLDQNMDS